MAKEFEPAAQAISNWVKQADLDDGRRNDGLTSTEPDELQRLRRENRRLKEEREILKKPQSSSLARPTRYPASFEFVAANQASHSVAALCRVLEVSSSGYYAWRKHEDSKRKREDASLSKRIETIHRLSRGTYGTPRIV